MKKFDLRNLLRFHGGSVLMVICGGILAVFPDSASLLVSAVLGWLLIALGVTLVIAGVIGGVYIVTLFQGAFLLAGGAWLHRNPLMIASVLGIVLGLVALSQGLRKGRRAIQLKMYGSFWIWDAGVAALELLAGLALLLTPLSLSRVVMTLAGIFMVISGGADLLASGKSGGSGGSRIIDAD